ncbi:hypothetical protein ABZ512_08790 [Nocardiopsis dassonvillei]|uniref:hypothetical protein n=1 Tax=Nocardiopsis dassonvillei TaxID=2014 RepID=UPI0033CE4508
MMSWSPTTRRNGVDGLASLLHREDWRFAEGEHLRSILRPFLDDSDKVCRLGAAGAAHLLDPDPGKALDLIRSRLGEEEVLEIGGTLAVRLGAFVNDHTDLVDQVVYDAAFGPWLRSIDEDDEQTDVMFVDGFVQIVLLVALRDRRPNALSLAQSWFEDPGDSSTCDRALILVRDFLTWDDIRVRERAFGLLLLAAEAAENTRSTVDTDSDEFGKAFLTANEISTTVYLASGAFQEEQGKSTLPSPGFCASALPVLRRISGFRAPAIVHHIVETLAHLAPEDPGAVLLCLRGAIDRNDPYSFDSLAEQATTRLCARYLSEFWEDIVNDEECLTALREVLGAFVHAGWPSAIELSNRLGDAFR